MADPLEFLLVSGSGFIGRHVARGLIDRGHRVTVLTRGQRGVVDGARMLIADRRDPVAVAAALGGTRFDLAVDFLVFDALDLTWLATIPSGTLARLVMISTGQVYLVTEGATPPFREDAAGGPVMAEPAPGTRDHANWAYGVGKRRAESALLALRETRGLGSVALRLPIVQGEGDGSLRLWAYLERMLDGGPLVLPDGGRRATRFVYAGDLAAVLERLADPSLSPATAYNLAQPDVVPLREFLARVARAAGIGPRFMDASWDACRDAGLDENFSPYAGRWSSVLDPGRAIAELGYAAISVEDYLPRVVRWHLEHRPATSDRGYAQRARELELAGRLGRGDSRAETAGFLDPAGADG